MNKLLLALALALTLALVSSRRPGHGPDSETCPAECKNEDGVCDFKKHELVLCTSTTCPGACKVTLAATEFCDMKCVPCPDGCDAESEKDEDACDDFPFCPKLCRSREELPTANCPAKCQNGDGNCDFKNLKEDYPCPDDCTEAGQGTCVGYSYCPEFAFKAERDHELKMCKPLCEYDSCPEECKVMAAGKDFCDMRCVPCPDGCNEKDEEAAAACADFPFCPRGGRRPSGGRPGGRPGR